MPTKMSRLQFWVLLVASIATTSASNSHYYTRLVQDPTTSSCTILEESLLQRPFKAFRTKDPNELYSQSRPSITSPEQEFLKSDQVPQLIEIWGRKSSIIDAHVQSFCKKVEYIQPLAPTQDIEIRKIIDGGNQTNRIDVVFMGDGYTVMQKEQFFSDMERLTTEMFEGVTFRSYLPVFNIWAIYVPSVDSGIGYDGAKNTPFRLYRAQGQLRGIYTGNAPYARQVCTMTGVSGCEYPSMIGNDDFYGGLGGEFVISTKSERTGTVVLRHEMGHNFVDVGEEYDNGQVYRGVNAASSLATIGWSHWLTNGPQPRAERAMYRILEYPWKDLYNEGIQVINFTSDGTYSRWSLTVSVSAAGEQDCLEFTLDGQILPWTSRGFDDREFYEWEANVGFTPGTHSFTVRTKTPPTHSEIPRMICSVRLHEFGNEAEFHADDNVVSAYPTWDVNRRITYRPTNNGCLMRNMTNPEFCPVCQEGMWYQFLRRISLIDEVIVSGTPNPDQTRLVILNTLKLGQLRAPGNEVEGERLEIRWFREGIEQIMLQDLFAINASIGLWEVEVRFVTPEVRHDPTNLLVERKAFVV